MGGLGADSRPSPAIIVAVLALVAAVAGTAVAADPPASTSALGKKKVKKIAKKQINKLAPGLSVAHATTADSATNADSATHADSATRADSATTAQSATVGGPVAFGLIDCTDASDCEVVAAESRGLTDSMVFIGGALGSACFNVPFTFRGAQVSVDLGLGETNQHVQYERRDGLCGGLAADAEAQVFNGTGAGEDSAFHIAFYK